MPAGLITTAALALMINAATPAPETYDIRISRPLNQGDVYTLTAVSKNVSSNTVSNIATKEVLQNEEDKFDTNFTGDVEILAVNDGIETKTKCKINNYERITKDGTTKVMPKDAELSVEWVDGEKAITQNGEAVSPELLSELSDILDQVSGNEGSLKISDKPRAVGEKWTIKGADKDFLAEIGDSFSVDPKDLSITGNLVEKKIINNVECVILKIDINLKKINIPLDEGMKMRNGKVFVSLIIAMPTDKTKPIQSETLKMSAEMAMENVAEKMLVNVVMQSELTRNFNFKPTKTVTK